MRGIRSFAALMLITAALIQLGGCGEKENKDLLKARALISKGDYEAAPLKVEAALKAEPQNPEALCFKEILSVRGKADPEAWRRVIERCLKLMEPVESEIDQLSSKEELDEDELKRLRRLIRSRNYAMGFLVKALAETAERGGWARRLFEEAPDLTVRAILKGEKCFDEEVRRRADQLILRMDGAAIKPLINQLSSADPVEKANAVRLLGLLKAEEAVEPLGRLAGSREESFEVIYEIPIALERIGGEGIIGPLRAVLKNQYAQPKIHAVKLLAELKAVEAIPDIIDLLAEGNSYVVSAAKSALISFGREAVPHLLGVLRTRAENVHLPPSATVTEDREVARRNSVVGAAMDVLADLMAVEAIPEIAAFLEDDDLRGSASSALVKFGPAATPALMEALKNPKSEVRVAAANALKSTLDKRAVKALLEALKDENKEVVAAAASALGAMKAREAVPQLSKLLADPDERIRTSVLDALNNIAYYDPEEVKMVLQVATDKSERESIRISALTVLKTLKPEEASDELIRIMMAEDETPDVRRAAVAALGEIKPKEALEPMLRIISALREKPKDYQRLLKKRYGTIEALNREWGTDYKLWTEIKPIPSLVRGEVALALGKIKGDEVVDPLIKALKDDDRAVVRKNAAWALGEIGGEKVIGPLIRALRKDDVGIVRNEAAVALGNIATKKATGALVKTLKSDKYETARKNAAWALSQIKDEAAVDDLIDVLSDKGKSEEERESEAVIEQVMNALVNIGSPSVEPLIGLLDHEQAYVRARAAHCLGQIADTSALEALTKAALEDESPMVRGYAISAIASLKTRKAVEPLLKVLGSEDEWKTNKAKAAEGLGKLRDERGVDPLLRCLRSGVIEVMEAAATALGEIRDYRAFDELLKLAGSTDPSVRIAAITALGEFGDPAAEDVLLKPLNGELTSQTLPIWEAAVEALGKIGSRKAVPRLMSILEDRSLPSSLRAKAAAALGEIGDERAIPILLDRVRDKTEYDEVWQEVATALGKLRVEEAAGPIAERAADTWESESLRATAAEALGRTGADEALKTLEELLSDGSETVRGGAILGLGRSHRPEVIDTLISIMQDSSKAESERYKAAKALGEFKGDKVIDALIETLNDTSAQESVRKNAADSLGRIGGDKAAQALMEAYRKKDCPIGLKRRIVSALGEAGSLKAVDLLREALGEDDPDLHYNAARSLYKLTGEAPGYKFGRG